MEPRKSDMLRPKRSLFRSLVLSSWEVKYMTHPEPSMEKKLETNPTTTRGMYWASSNSDSNHQDEPVIARLFYSSK